VAPSFPAATNLKLRPGSMIVMGRGEMEGKSEGREEGAGRESMRLIYDELG
jgi:hypothetical protein